MASTTSPTRSLSERPKGATGRCLRSILQHGEVGIGVAAHDAGVRDALVGELDADGIGVGDHVMVGHDVPVVRRR